MTREAELLYRPFRKQREFHALTTEVAAFTAGWGTGKTTAGIGEAWRNTCFQPGIPGLFCSPTFRIMRKTFIRELVRLLPGATRWPRGQECRPGRVEKCLGPLVHEWNATDKVLTMKVGDPKSPISRGGTDWHFASVDDPGSIEGGTYGFGVLDEPRLVSREAWEVFNSRIRDTRAKVLRRSVTGVPAMGWMDEELNRGLPGRSFVRGSSDDNPYLPPGYVDQLNLSGRKARAFRFGFFVHLEGTVYEDYVPIPEPGEQGSVIDHRFDPKLATRAFLDFGRLRPYFGLIQTLPDGSEVVFDEVVSSTEREPVHAARCAALCERYGLELLAVWCDPAGKTPNSQTGLPSLQLYEAALRPFFARGCSMRYTLRPVERYKPNRVEAVSVRLMGVDGRRRLFIARELTERQYADGAAGIHRGLLGLVYPKGSNDPRPKKDGIHDHPCDALEYYVVGEHGILEAPDLLAMNNAGGASRDSFGVPSVAVADRFLGFEID